MKGRATLFESPDSLAKRWELIDGKPVKTTAAQMARGSFRVIEFGDVAELAAVLEGVTTHQALCTSLPKDGSVSGRIVTVANLASSPGAKARTKAAFGLAPGLGLLFIDCDEAGIRRDELWHMLLDAVPALAGAGVVWRPSGSSHIFHGDTDLTGLRGQHGIVTLKDTSDGPRVLKIIADRLWLAGHGRIKINKAGSMMEHCPIDLCSTQAARLVFAGGAECVPPLEQRRGPPVILSDGGFLDSRELVPDLTADELGRAAALRAQAKLICEPEAVKVRAAHRADTLAKRVPELMREGVAAGDAEKRIGAAVDAAYGGVLLGDFELTIVHADGRHEVVTVNAILRDRQRWHECDCLDPLNPGHRGGAADGRLFLMGGSPIVFSFDDSGQVCRLRPQQIELTTGKGARGELVEALATIVAGLDYVFATSTGPVIVDVGRQHRLTPELLMNIVGREVALFVQGKTKAAADLTLEQARLVLAALSVRGSAA
jgi:hypothetical protein